MRSVSITGFSGAVVSVAGFTSLGVDLFPDASVAVAVTSPTGMSSVGVIVTLPVSSAVPLPISLSPTLTTTVEPFSAFTTIGVFVFALPVRSVSITGFSGAVVSVISTVTSFSGDTLPWLSVAFSLTVYLPGWFVLIVLFPVLPFTDTTSTCVPLPLVRPRLSSLSLALTKSVRFKVEPASTTFLSP